MIREARHFVSITTVVLFLSSIFILSGCCCLGGLGSDDTIVIPNRAPNAVLAARAASQSEVTGEVPFEATLDGSASTDSDGEIVDYAWDFDGDGTFDQNGPEAIVNHTYEVVGVYAVTLRVTDDDGATDTDIAIVTVGNPPLPPEAAGTAAVDSENPLLVSFDASDSFDSDGEIVRYDWDFDNDGTFELLDGGVTTQHEYPDFGSKTAVVRVTDNDGNTDTAQIPVTLLDAPSSVTAAVTATPASGDAPLDVEFDASGSTSMNSSIVSYDWDLDDDGTFEVTDGGPTQSATYENLIVAASIRTPSAPSVGEGGESVYTISVRVSDDKSNVDTASTTVTVNPVPNQPPVAEFSTTPAQETLGTVFALDGSASSDADGTIVSYDWDFEDDGTVDESNATPTTTFEYLAPGTFTVRLTVTDDDGATDTTTHDILVNDPPVANLVGNVEGDVPEAHITWDASGSTDSDGTIVQYDWDMDNDGTFEITDGGDSQDGGFFQEGGDYTVCVRVTDDFGATDQVCTLVHLNDPPTADLVVNPENAAIPMSGNLDIQLDASGSTDSDGTIVQYNWDLDGDFTFEVQDGGPTQTVNVTDDAVYQFFVEVVDNEGLSDSTSGISTIVTPPTAVLTASQPDNEQVVWDASGSFDNNGIIVRYDWDENNDGDYDDPNDVMDGNSTFEDFLTFGEPGDTKTVRVRVTDDDGLTDETTHTYTWPFWPEAIILRTPEPDFSGEGPDGYFGNSRLITLDGSTSFDQDGTIVQYDWDLDGDFVFEIIDGPATLVDQLFELVGQEFSHQFFINLRVTDNDGYEGYDSDTFILEEQPA